MAEAGEMLMMPPTYLTSLEVSQFAGPVEVIEAAHGRTAEMHTPGVEPLEDGWTLSIPAHLRPVLAARHPCRMSDAWAGGTFGERARCLLAPNPGLMTLDGTNTWVLREPGLVAVGRGRPGPDRGGPPRPASTSRPATSRWCC